MKFRKAATVLLAAALACTLTVTPVLADEVDDLKQQKEDVQSEVEDLQSQLNTLMQKMSDLEDELISTGQEITQTEEDLKQAEEDEQEQYEAMKLRIKYMYEAGTGSADLEKVLSSGDMSGMLSQAEYSQQVHNYDREKLEEYVATTEKVKELKTSLEDKQDDLEAAQEEYQAQQAEMSSTIEEKSAEIENLDDMIQEAARKAQEEEEARQRAAAAGRKQYNDRRRFFKQRRQHPEYKRKRCGCKSAELSWRRLCMGRMQPGSIRLFRSCKLLSDWTVCETRQYNNIYGMAESEQSAAGRCLRRKRTLRYLHRRRNDDPRGNRRRGSHHRTCPERHDLCALRRLIRSGIR